MPLPESGARPRTWPDQAEPAEFIEHTPGSTEPRFTYERPGERTDVIEGQSSTTSTKQRVMETGRHAVDVSKKHISETAAKIQSGAQRGLDGILDALGEGRARGKQGLDILERQLRSYPLVGLGIAFVVGVAAGKLIRRSLR